MPKLEKSIIVLAGLPFSGKSTIGKELSTIYGVPFLDIDETRQEIEPGNEWLGRDREKEIMLTAYKRNHDKASKVLGSGKVVILAATYSRENYHAMLRELAARYKVPLHVFLLHVSEDLAMSRMQERIEAGSASNIVNEESFREVRDRYIAFQGDELTVIDTSGPLTQTVKSITDTMLN